MAFGDQLAQLQQTLIVPLASEIDTRRVEFLSRSLEVLFLYELIAVLRQNSIRRNVNSLETSNSMPLRSEWQSCRNKLDVQFLPTIWPRSSRLFKEIKAVFAEVMASTCRS
jgi:hypothetical protein